MKPRCCMCSEQIEVENEYGLCENCDRIFDEHFSDEPYTQPMKKKRRLED